MAIERIKPVDIELNPTLAPIEGAPRDSGNNDKPHTEPDAERGLETEVRFGWENLERWVVRVWPGTVNAGRAVDRRINELRIGRLDDDALAFGCHPLLSVRPERPRLRGFVAKTLDRIGKHKLHIRFWREGEETAFEVIKGDPKLVERCDLVSKVAQLMMASDPI